MGIDDWGFRQAFRASIEGQLWETASSHELGAGLKDGADFITLFKCDRFLERKGFFCSPRQAPGCGYSLVLDPGAAISSWFGGHADLPEMRGSRRSCIIEFGNAEPIQVRSLTKTQHLVQKPHKPKTLCNVSGSGGWCRDPGLCKTRSWVSGVNLGVAY